MVNSRIGIIGGSGIYQIDSIKNVESIMPITPFGRPSAPIITGSISDREVAFLPRHGEEHAISPSLVPTKANIYALKSIGVTRIISISAVGSLRENIHPLDLVIPDQLIDNTKHRSNSFFGDGIVAHVAFAQPFCSELRKILTIASERVGAKVHKTGTYIVIEGPQFSTKAESHLYRSWGCDIIGMTALPEAKLAREAEMCYATIACSTDYDCWRENEEPVSADIVLNNLGQNAARSKLILEGVIASMDSQPECQCNNALNNAIVTPHDAITRTTRDSLGIIIERYME